MNFSELPASALSQGAAKYAIKSRRGMLVRKLLAMAAGLFLGAVNGAFGAGGGMLAVPALTYILGYDQRSAHAAAIAVILPLCAVSVAIYSIRASFDVAVILPTAIGVILGVPIGALLLKKLPENVVGFLFYGLMLLSGIKLLMG